MIFLDGSMLSTSSIEGMNGSNLGDKEPLIKSSSKDTTSKDFFASDQHPSAMRSTSMYDDDKKIVFQNLDPAASYTVRVATVMNGIEIAAKEAKIYQMG